MMVLIDPSLGQLSYPLPSTRRAWGMTKDNSWELLVRWTYEILKGE